MTDTHSVGPDTADTADAIAVVGMAGRFPGARTLAEYWRNLRAGVESIVTLTEEDLRRSGIDVDAVSDRRYIRTAAPLDGVEEFDAELFGFTAAVAEGLDPQHRLFLQTVWHAVEDAGYDPRALDGAVGVYGTSSASGYLLNNLMSRLDVNRIIGQGASFEMIDLSLRNDKDHIATRVAHQFDLRGPALSVQTACSSSAVAVHLACQALLSGEVDAAIAGGSSIRVPNAAGYWHEPGAMTSPSGHCRPFDARADGTVFGSAVGVVMLKTVEKARADGDQIHAVILGSAINNDGAAKMTYAAPTAAGQAAAIAEAHAIAGIDASEVTYVETHGTGTPLGDPVELEGLRQAFELAEAERTQPCRLGSVKANIGHTEVASGIAGILKAILCLKHRELPGTVHYTAPNPELHLDRGPFEIRADLSAWDSPEPLRAGVSSFGVGGTNVHLVLGEAPAPVPTGKPSQDGPYPLIVTAHSDERLTVGRAALADHLEADDSADLADVASTLAARPTGRVRGVTIVRDRAHAVSALRAGEGISEVVPDGASEAADRVVLLFPGQGSQYVGMARGLYDAEPEFAEHFDKCANGFGATLGIDLKDLIFSGRPRELERTDRSQAALFTVEYALARVLQSRGVQPSLLLGHSVGEYVAATLAGVFDLPTAISVVAERGRVMQSAPTGVMLAVPLGSVELQPYLGAEIDIATINEPGGCVVAGTADAITALTAQLAADGITARRVRTSHAFHSRLMDSAAADFHQTMSRVALREPKIDLGSNVTGKLMTASEASDPQTWVRQIRSTVQFVDELEVALANPHAVLIEVGPGGTLTSAAKRHPKFGPSHRTVRLLRHPAQDRADHDVFLEGLGQLWAADVNVDLRVPVGRRVLVPGYPFLPTRHWIAPLPGNRAPGPRRDEASGSASAASGAPAATIEATLGGVWAACLGVDSVDPNADFFDLGGDSLIAIGVSMGAGHAGIDLTPQDLYDHPTVASLAAAVGERDAAGALAHSDVESDHPPLPPNFAGFLDSGIADHHRWRMPIVLCLRPDIDRADVTAVLTALAQRHQALRLTLDQRDGMWTQSIAPVDGDAAAAPIAVVERTLAEGVDHDTAAQEHLAAAIADLDPAAAPLTALLLRDPAGGTSRLALTLHAVAGDPRSRDILVGDLLTAFSQRTAGIAISLPPEPTTWERWSQRIASFASHPEVLATYPHWRASGSQPAVRLAENDPAERPYAADYRTVRATLGAAETAELDDIRRRTGVRLDELVTAAVVRAIGAVAGPGPVAIDVDGDARAILRPDLDLRDTVGWFGTVYPLMVEPFTIDGSVLETVRSALRGTAHHGIGYGLLRYLHAPTAAQLANLRRPDLHLSIIGTVPEPPPIPEGSVPVWFGADTSLPVRATVPGLGHAVELRVYRSGGRLHFDWWYDQRRLGADRIDQLAAGVSDALVELARDAAGNEAVDTVDSDWELVDLSGGDAG